jgi:hypothetical protein
MVHGLHPELHPEFGTTRVQTVEVSAAHLAVGIWVATAAVLILPSLGKTKHRVGEQHLLKAYSVAMSAFPLL